MKQWQLWLFTSMSTALFASFATSIVCYLSLVVPVSPWIDPTLALVSLGIVVLCGRWASPQMMSDVFLMATATGSAGGMVGTALAWSIPTLYFLDPALFAAWLKHPFSFVSMIFLLVVGMGGIGLFIARLFMHDDAGKVYRFPIAQVVHQTIAARTAIKEALLLLVGSVSALLFHGAQVLFFWIPRVVQVLGNSSFGWWHIPAVKMYTDFVPMLWAIGSITGEIIAIPFIVGLLLKIALLDPCYRLWFASCLAESTFSLSFCTGLVLEGFVVSVLKLVLEKKQRQEWTLGTCIERLITWYMRVKYSVRTISLIEFLFVMICSVILLHWVAHLSIFGTCYVLLAAMLCAYQLILFMGRVGLAPLGRFAAFVVVPGAVLFGYTPFQATLVAACIEICGGVAASFSSGIRATQLDHIRHGRLLCAMQWMALIVSALAGGVIFWMLANYIGIGSAELGASRAQVRALLLQANNMHVGSMIFGGIVAWVLQRYKIHTELVLGGIVMPLDWSFILILSGLAHRFLKRWGDLTALWSGMLATSSLWMVVRVLWRH